MIGNKYCCALTREDVRACKEGLGIRFTAPKTGFVDKVSLFLMWGFEAPKPKTVPKYAITIHADDYRGKPAMILSTTELGGEPDWTKHVGWKAIPIPSRQLLLGQIYHIIWKVTDFINPEKIGFVLEGQVIRQTNWNPFAEVSRIMPRSQLADMAFCSEKNDLKYHKDWDTYAQQPNFLIHYVDGDVYGNPYCYPMDVHLGYRTQPSPITQAIGQEFEVLKEEEISKLLLWLKKVGGPDKLYVSLFSYNTETYVFEDFIFSDGLTFSSYYKWLTKKFALLTLTKGKYRLELKSPNSEPYKNSYATKVYRAAKMDPEILKAVYYNGAKQSQDNGQTWTDFGVPSDFSFTLW